MVWARACFLINIQKEIQNTVHYHFNSFYLFCLVCDVILDGKRTISCHLSVAAQKMYFLHMTFQMADTACITDGYVTAYAMKHSIYHQDFLFTNTHRHIALYFT
jgi:hypothetical protein